MSIALPQFRDHPRACRADRKGPVCKRCRAKGERYADWREAQTGQREFACPFPAPSNPAPAVKDSLTPASPKPARAPQEVIELRVLMDCEHRTPEGRCLLSKSCQGNCTCLTVATWRRCPAGLWDLTVRMTDAQK